MPMASVGNLPPCVDARGHDRDREPLPAYDQDRADMWALIAALLLQPSEPLLRSLSLAPGLPGSADSTLASAWNRLVEAARTAGPRAVQHEHAALFVAVGTPLVDPYASLYRGGFLMDGTLARLRADLRALGQARHPEAAHTEDHLGALCETMCLLIAGADGLARRTGSVQQRFLTTHLLPWAEACLHDMRNAPGANFYAALADFAQTFLDSECQVLELDVAISPEPHHADHAVPA